MRIDERIDVNDVEVRALFEQVLVREVSGKSVLGRTLARADLLRGWRVALDRALRRGLDATIETWVQSQFCRLLRTEEATDETRALAAEVEAALGPSWIGRVSRIDGFVAPDVRLPCRRIQCRGVLPAGYREERWVVEVDLGQKLRKATGPVKVAIVVSHPNTGSGRRVDNDGRVVKDPGSQVAHFPVNKLIDRVLSSKRMGKQFPEGSRTSAARSETRSGVVGVRLHPDSIRCDEGNLLRRHDGRVARLLRATEATPSS